MRSLVLLFAGGLIACGGGSDDGDGDGTPTNRAPLANAGQDLTVIVDDPAMLTGSATDREDDPVTFTWSVMSAPAGSVAQPADPGAAATSFTPDVPGTYTMLLTASDGMGSDTDFMTVVARVRGVPPLDHDVVDAEYSTSLDRIIMVADDPRALFIYDPATGNEIEIALPLPALALSVSPDGTEAVVGHDGWVSWVQLEAGATAVTHEMSAVTVDIVHGGNGFAYILPLHDQGELVRCIELETGVETLGMGGIYAGSRGRRHPLRPQMYLADRGLSPDDIELHDLSGGTSVRLRDSPYHGDFDMCGDLWLAKSGDRIFTACGNIFRSSTDPGIDMTYNGSLSNAELVQYVDHSIEAGLFAVIPANDMDNPLRDTEVQLYEDEFVGYAESLAFPPMQIGVNETTAHARFVFWNRAGTQLYVIVRGFAGGSHDGVWVHDTNDSP